jgi:hypothetical protein
MRWVALILTVFVFGTADEAVALNLPEATHAYKRIWNEDRRLLGVPRARAPFVFLGTDANHARARTILGGGGKRIIVVSNGVTKQLASSNPRKVADARSTIEHEFARVFQPDSIFSPETPNAGGRPANKLARILAHRRRTGRGDVKGFAQAHLPHYGEAPRKIRTPVTL